MQAVARALVFSTTEPRLAPAIRTISVDVTDGDGGSSNMSFFTVSQSQVRRYGFQENVDNGQGYYAGAGDVMLYEPRPNDNVPIANNPTEGLLVDYDGGTSNSAVLLKFEVSLVPIRARYRWARAFSMPNWYWTPTILAMVVRFIAC